MESFNARLWDEPLSGDIFYSLREAEIILKSWRRHYNTVRPHASLGYRPPAPEVIVPALAAWPAAPPRPALPASLTVAPRPRPNQHSPRGHPGGLIKAALASLGCESRGNACTRRPVLVVVELRAPLDLRYGDPDLRSCPPRPRRTLGSHRVSPCSVINTSSDTCQKRASLPLGRCLLPRGQSGGA